MREWEKISGGDLKGKKWEGAAEQVQLIGSKQLGSLAGSDRFMKRISNYQEKVVHKKRMQELEAQEYYMI